MINWQSILSSFDDKPTLLEWLKKVQKALNESTLTTVTVTQEKAGRVNSITLSFNFQDGTKIVAPAFTVNDGVDGVAGIGITDLINTNLTYDNLVVTYDTTDGLRVFSTQSWSYSGGYHNSGLEFRLPIMAGSGINIDKRENTQEIEIKADAGGFKSIFGNQSVVGTGNIDLYVHNMTFHLPDGDCYGRWYSSNNLNLNSLTNIKTVFGNTFKLPLFGDVPKSGGVAVMLTETELIMDELKWNYSDFTFTDDVKTL